MKIRKFSFPLFTVMLAILAAGCTDNRDYSKDIERVMQARQQAYADATTVAPGNGPFPIVTVTLQTYLDEMQKIDVSACPRDFRGAWNDYIEALQARVAKDPVLRYPNAGGAGGKWDVSLDHNGMDFRDLWDRLDAAAERHDKPPGQ